MGIRNDWHWAKKYIIFWFFVAKVVETEVPISSIVMKPVCVTEVLFVNECLMDIFVCVKLVRSSESGVCLNAVVVALILSKYQLGIELDYDAF